MTNRWSARTRHPRPQICHPPPPPPKPPQPDPPFDLLLSIQAEWQPVGAIISTHYTGPTQYDPTNYWSWKATWTSPGPVHATARVTIAPGYHVTCQITAELAPHAPVHAQRTIHIPIHPFDTTDDQTLDGEDLHSSYWRADRVP